jgi:cell division protein FtsL
MIITITTTTIIALLTASLYRYYTLYQKQKKINQQIKQQIKQKNNENKILAQQILILEEHINQK